MAGEWSGPACRWPRVHVGQLTTSGASLVTLVVGDAGQHASDEDALQLVLGDGVASQGRLDQLGQGARGGREQEAVQAVGGGLQMGAEDGDGAGLEPSPGARLARSRAVRAQQCSAGSARGELGVARTAGGVTVRGVARAEGVPNWRRPPRAM